MQQDIGTIEMIFGFQGGVSAYATEGIADLCVCIILGRRVF